MDSSDSDANEISRTADVLSQHMGAEGEVAFQKSENSQQFAAQCGHQPRRQDHESERREHIQSLQLDSGVRMCAAGQTGVGVSDDAKLAYVRMHEAGRFAIITCEKSYQEAYQYLAETWHRNRWQISPAKIVIFPRKISPTPVEIPASPASPCLLNVFV